MSYFLIFFILLVIILILLLSRKNHHRKFLENYYGEKVKYKLSLKRVYKYLSGNTNNILRYYKDIIKKRKWMQILCVPFFLTLSCLYSVFTGRSALFFILISLIIGVFIQRKLFISDKIKIFQKSFPELLTLVSMGCQSGANIYGIILLCAKQLKGDLGLEFKRIHRRLAIGESIESVFEESYNKFPYKEFYLLISTFMIGLNQGGQICHVIEQIYSHILQNKMMEEKKRVLTAQARISLRLTFFIPVMIYASIYYFSPKMLDPLLETHTGKLIVLYCVISNILGIVAASKLLGR